MTQAANQPKPMEPFTDADRLRLSDLLANLSSVDGKHHQFVQDMNARLTEYRYPKRTAGQSRYIRQVHDGLVKQGIAAGVNEL